MDRGRRSFVQAAQEQRPHRGGESSRGNRAGREFCPTTRLARRWRSDERRTNQRPTKLRTKKQAPRPRGAWFSTAEVARQFLTNVLQPQSCQRSNPTGRALVAGHDQTQWAFAGIERLTVTMVGHKNDLIGEAGIKFSQREHRLVTIGAARDDAHRHVRPAQLLAQWSTSELKNFPCRYAFIDDSGSVLVADADFRPR